MITILNGVVSFFIDNSFRDSLFVIAFSFPQTYILEELKVCWPSNLWFSSGNEEITSKCFPCVSIHIKVGQLVGQSGSIIKTYMRSMCAFV